MEDIVNNFGLIANREGILKNYFDGIDREVRNSFSMQDADGSISNLLNFGKKFETVVEGNNAIGNSAVVAEKSGASEIEIFADAAAMFFDAVESFEDTVDDISRGHAAEYDGYKNIANYSKNIAFDGVDSGSLKLYRDLSNGKGSLNSGVNAVKDSLEYGPTLEELGIGLAKTAGENSLNYGEDNSKIGGSLLKNFSDCVSLEFNAGELSSLSNSIESLDVGVKNLTTSIGGISNSLNLISSYGTILYSLKESIDNLSKIKIVSGSDSSGGFDGRSVADLLSKTPDLIKAYKESKKGKKGKESKLSSFLKDSGLPEYLIGTTLDIIWDSGNPVEEQMLYKATRSIMKFFNFDDLKTRREKKLLKERAANGVNDGLLKPETNDINTDSIPINLDSGNSINDTSLGGVPSGLNNREFQPIPPTTQFDNTSNISGDNNVSSNYNSVNNSYTYNYYINANVSDVDELVVGLKNLQYNNVSGVR